MCGISGIVNFERGLDDESQIVKMNSRLSHRGPDSDGIFSDGFVTLGHTRLKVIDLSDDANQPLFNSDSSIVVVFNGEIYNHIDIRHKLESRGYNFKTNTDTEILVHGYQEFGIGLLDYLNGMFSFAIYDSKNKKILLARDRLGIKPLYYFNSGQSFIFASEINALKSIMKEKDKKLDKESIKLYFSHMYFPGSRTVYEKIKKLNPSQYVVIDISSKKIKKRSFWEPKYINIKNYDKEFDKLLTSSIQRRLISDVPLGCFLSGGLDSSSITAIASEHNPDVSTYSVGFGEGEPNELPYARVVSEHLGTNHHELYIDSLKTEKEIDNIVTSMDEPSGDGGFIPTYFLSQLAKKQVTVCLSGEGADEILGGYEKYKLLKYKSLIPRSNLIYNKYKWSKNHLQRLISTSFAPNHYSSFNQMTHIGKDAIEEVKILQDQNFSQFSNLQYNDLRGRMVNSFLMKVDRMSMAHSLEVRVPFLDHRLVDFGLSLPVNQKISVFREKEILRRWMRGKLPSEIINRKKRGFRVPVNIWLKNHFASYLEESNNYYYHDYFGEKEFRKAIHLIANKGSNFYSNYFYSCKLWAYYVFDKWIDLNHPELKK